MDHNIAFIFPGQGSQSPGMARDIFDEFEEARAVFHSVDSALDIEISRICFEGTEEELRLTANTQPAILTVSAAILAVVRSRSSLRCDIVAGHSLGEYSAIVAAGGLEASEAAKIVRSRGTFMQEAVPVGEGAMAALIGPTREDVERICEEASDGEVVSLANINAPGQIVIAGKKSAVNRAIEVAKGRGVRKALMLPVSAPFHCEMMKTAVERLTPILESAPFKDLDVPLVSNVDASPIGTARAIRNALTRQVVNPVRWVESIEKMISMGVTKFVEIGPGKVLTGLMRRIDRSVEATTVRDLESLEAFLSG